MTEAANSNVTKLHPDRYSPPMSAGLAAVAAMRTPDSAHHALISEIVLAQVMLEDTHARLLRACGQVSNPELAGKTLGAIHLLGCAHVALGAAKAVQL